MTVHGAVAVLRGTRELYFICKNEVLVGRSTDEQKVDIDLSLEGAHCFSLLLPPMSSVCPSGMPFHLVLGVPSICCVLRISHLRRCGRLGSDQLC